MDDPFLSYPRPPRRVVVGLDDLAADVGGTDVLGAREGVATLAQFIRKVVRQSVWKWNRVNLRMQSILRKSLQFPSRIRLSPFKERLIYSNFACPLFEDTV